MLLQVMLLLKWFWGNGLIESGFDGLEGDVN
jgi:hypothetical protein